MTAMFVNKLNMGIVNRAINNVRLICSAHGLDLHPEKEEPSLHGKMQRTALYPSHIPTTLIQKILLTLGSSVVSISDPYRHDMVAVLGETTGYLSAKKIRDIMLQDVEGSAILSDRPRISSETIDFQYLKSLPAGTFGHAYMKFLNDNKVTPDTRQPVHFVDDVDLAYIIQRYREVHDFVHTLLCMPTNILGEVAVKWVEAIQTGLPMCAAGALFGPLQLRPKQRKLYVETYLPWALECGHKAKFLMNVYFEKRWEQNITTLRTELNIPEPPL
ncbi:ubiquinone biosynthesis protein COQ4 homolog, mitochondrial-like [Uloborus diversus]|uniref:ubiquinone biosynthesis protein COQ4 homolog, mitochondrial-like n=1 Tax=Uloborus diversus TaxID=327109 RepID=UPI00240969F9|nr:ubiquinone biosynthesis protein COQ4 homolog, mitochondrial-like [Uloborus diversus]XP_054721613.1 ubiquinone biosynthesis protein COQ4 homolog, mitochondrial-like [Uloborus diversus]